MKTLKRTLILLAMVTGALLAPGSASAETTTYTNATSINVADSGHETSSISVGGQPGRITDVKVTLDGIRHTLPRDFDILLLSPDGDSSILTSDACGGGFAGGSLTFSRSADAALPELGECSGTYRPADFGSPSNDDWPGEGFDVRSADLDPFAGGLPNGTWRLLVVDDTLNLLRGGLSRGWSITITTVQPSVVVPSGGSEGIANPYPLTKTVSGKDGAITDVDVSLTGVFHETPDDLDILLVGPQGQKVMLMSDACGTRRLVGESFVWSEGANSMPAAVPCLGGLVGPTDHEPGETLHGPAPAGPYGTDLGVFDGRDANGRWQLFIEDDQAFGTGFVVQDFDLTIQTRSGAPVSFAQRAIDVTEGETGALTLTRTLEKGSGPGVVTVTSTPRSAGSGADFEPVSTTVEFTDEDETKTVHVRALTDGVDEGPETFDVTISDGRGDASPGDVATATVTVRNRAAGPNAAADTVAPQISGLRLKKRRFHYTLSEPASVRVVIERRKRGRWVRVRRTLTRASAAGSNRLRLPRRLGAGRYRAVFVATDAAGNHSRPARVRFRIRRG